jgi:subtilisin family serine protease
VRVRALPTLIRRDAVAGVERNRMNHPTRSFAFDDPFVQYQWWRGAVGADAVAPPGPGVPITILDSGVDVSHPEFGGLPLTALNQQILTDSADDFHGTMVASVAAAPVNGVGTVGMYPGANVWAYDARNLSDANIIAGIDAAVRRGRSVIATSSCGARTRRRCSPRARRCGAT